MPFTKGPHSVWRLQESRASLQTWPAPSADVNNTSPKQLSPSELHTIPYVECLCKFTFPDEPSSIGILTRSTSLAAGGTSVQHTLTGPGHAQASPDEGIPPPPPSAGPGERSSLASAASEQSDQVVPERLLPPTGALGSLAHGTCERREGGSAWHCSRSLVNCLSRLSFPAQNSGLYEESAMSNICAVTSIEPGMLPRRRSVPRARRWRLD